MSDLLENVRAGDRLMLVWHNPNLNTAAVVRGVTKTLVHTTPGTFLRRDDMPYSETPARTEYLRPMTEEETESFNRSMARIRLESSFRAINCSSLSDSQLERMIEISKERNNEGTDNKP
jgi:hypothetical protein